MQRLTILVLIVGLTGAAHAQAPEPRRPVNLGRFVGRWYEIMRTPNSNESDCVAASQDWTRTAKGDFSIQQHCRKADGGDKTVSTTAKVLNPPANTKFEASFFGGLVHGRYWVVDHADDYRWMIATTENGKYPALLARSQKMPAGEQKILKARMASLGFAVGSLQPSGAVGSSKTRKTRSDD